MFCTDWKEFSDLSFYIFTNNVPRLLYYSYLPTSLLALFVGFFVYFKNRQDLTCKLLFSLSVVFFISKIADLITWTNFFGDVIMFSWSLVYIFDILIYVIAFYIVYSFVNKKELDLLYKIFIFILLLPIFLFASSRLAIFDFNTTDCEPKQGFLIYYFYFLQIFFSLLSISFLLINFLKRKGAEKKQTGLFLLGMTFFLLALSWSSIFGNFTQNWELTQYGNFGMPIFLGILAYLIVKHQLFGIKLIATQVLTSAIVILIGAQFAFIRTPINRWLNGITFVLALIFGWVLVRSVKREIKTREEIELVSDKLAVAYSKLKKLDNAKTEFLSIASHQLRTPLTSIKGYMSMIMGGDFGKVPKEFTSPMEKIYISNERLIKLVEDLLNISRIETGRLVFAFNQNEVGKLAQEVFDTMSIVAKNKGLKLEYFPPKTPIATFLFDATKIREVFSNLVDNSLKYTKQGWVKILLTETAEKVTFCVSDSGMGIAEDELQYIFEKFQRGQEAGTAQSEGTGLGLYVCQKIVEAHHGKIWVESKGLGQGSQFYVELDKHFIPTKGETR